MIVRAIEVQVKPERAAEFVAATLENHRNSLREPGVLRFDVLQSAEDPPASCCTKSTATRPLRSAQANGPLPAWKQAVDP